ncbi:MAG: hypothetical protein ACE5WD_10570 [Candidatus Aminicenantia bacterium]
MSKIEVIPVKTKKEKKNFIRFLWKIYQNDPNWVPPLIVEQKELFNPKKHPFYKHGEVELFLAKSNGEIVGRIAAIINRNHNAYYKDKIGFFGFFESVNSKDVSTALFQTVEKWLRIRGMDRMRGPMNFSINEECGLLIEDFNLPPAIMMTYNPKYYIELYEGHGLKKIKELYAYYVDKNVQITEKMIHVVERLKRDSRITFRNINMKDLKNEVKKIKEIYNQAWSENWGAVEMTDEEFDYLASKLKQIVDPRLVYIAEVDDKPVGFSLALPDINQALKKINGRLFPFGLIRLLWYMKKIDVLRVITMGVIREFRRRGVDALFYYDTINNGIALGYKGAETSWVLEDNVPMNRILQYLKADLYKKYAIYEKEI